MAMKHLEITMTPTEIPYPKTVSIKAPLFKRGAFSPVIVITANFWYNDINYQNGVDGS